MKRGQIHELDGADILSPGPRSSGRVETDPRDRPGLSSQIPEARYGAKLGLKFRISSVHGRATIGALRDRTRERVPMTDLARAEPQRFFADRFDVTPPSWSAHRLRPPRPGRRRRHLPRVPDQRRAGTRGKRCQKSLAPRQPGRRASGPRRGAAPATPTPTRSRLRNLEEAARQARAIADAHRDVRSWPSGTAAGPRPLRADRVAPRRRSRRKLDLLVGSTPRPGPPIRASGRSSRA